jgi:hypothetical protein
VGFNTALALQLLMAAGTDTCNGDIGPTPREARTAA